MRRWAGPSLPGVAGWLDPAVAGLATESYVSLSGDLVVNDKIEADLVIGVGDRRVLHTEFEKEPRARLVARMFNYRARLMLHEPEVELTQHVVVLGNGVVSGHDDLSRGFMLDLKTFYVREKDPSMFLGDPLLAPFAALARGTRAVRAEAFRAAVLLLRDSGHPRTPELLQIASILASIRLNPVTIDTIRKESEMELDAFDAMYATTFTAGRHLVQTGVQQGLEQGLEQGKQQARQRMLAAVLRSRFGAAPQVDAVAARLSSWSEDDAVAAALAADDLPALMTVVAPGEDRRV